MATQFCQKCKQSHPGRLCDYDDKGECAETSDLGDPEQDETANPSTRAGEPSHGSKQ
jgi:hypothetical protein